MIPVFISVVNADAGRTDNVDVVRRDAIGIFLLSNKVVDTFISAAPGFSLAVIPYLLTLPRKITCV